MRVGLIVPTETAGANWPEVVGVVEAAAMAINERGGIAGHEVEIAYCNEGDDPNQAAECAQEMVDEGVIATVSSFSRSGAQNIYDVLEPAGVAQVAPIAVSAVDFTNPVAFPVNAALLNFIGCGALFAPAAEVDSLGAIQFDVDASTQTITLAQLGASSVDTPFTTSVRVPPTATDFAPSVGEVADSGAQGVVLSLPEQQSIQTVQTASQLGEELAFCHVDAGLSADSLSQLGDAAEGVYVVEPVPDPVPARRDPRDAADVRRAGRRQRGRRRRDRGGARQGLEPRRLDRHAGDRADRQHASPAS